MPFFSDSAANVGGIAGELLICAEMVRGMEGCATDFDTQDAVNIDVVEANGEEA